MWLALYFMDRAVLKSMLTQVSSEGTENTERSLGRMFVRLLSLSYHSLSFQIPHGKKGNLFWGVLQNLRTRYSGREVGAGMLSVPSFCLFLIFFFMENLPSLFPSPHGRKCHLPRVSKLRFSQLDKAAKASFSLKSQNSQRKTAIGTVCIYLVPFLD